MGRVLTNSLITLSNFMKSSSPRNEILYSTNMFRRKSYRNGSNNGLPSKSCNKLSGRVCHILISDRSFVVSRVIIEVLAFERGTKRPSKNPISWTTSTYLNGFVHKLRAKRKVTQEAHGNREALVCERDSFDALGSGKQLGDIIPKL